MTTGGDGINYINKRTFSEDHRKKIGNSCRGEKHYNYGKNAFNIKSIYMFDINGVFQNEFSSIKEASKKTNILVSAISNCLTGKRNSSGGYIWTYKNNYTIDILTKKVIDCKNHPSNKNKSIKIKKIDINTNEIVEIYQSYKEAARQNNTSDVALKYACCKSKSHIYNDYKWMCHEKN